MSRNQNSHFAMVPRANVPRSRFDISNQVTTTCNAGLLFPIEHWEVLAGDSFKMSVSMLTRMQTLITPLMTDMYCDVMFFYSPNRLLWEHWEEFCGDDPVPWFDERPEYSVPQHIFSMKKNHQFCVMPHTVADHMGYPLPFIDSDEDNEDHFVSVSALPMRMYTRVWNEWFKSESLQNNAAFMWSDENTYNSSLNALGGGVLLPVNKYRDYYTSCLPAPEFNGNNVTIGIGDSAPVFTGGLISRDVLQHGQSTIPDLYWRPQNDSSVSSNGTYDIKAHITGNDGGFYALTKGVSDGTATTGAAFVPGNLYADISAATGITINELRMAFATQRYWEAIARHGSRYNEWLSGIWGVTAPDSRVQRTEFLGGTRVHINVNQVIQNSETNTTPLGNIGAYSLTTDTQDIFDRSFVEPGIIMAFACVRYDHSYQDGVDPQDLRKDFFDYYNPMFANLGETGVKNASIFAQGTDVDNEIFGYQEYAGEYRFKNNRVTGEFRSRYAETLDYWHLADNYNSLPYLGQDWIREDGDAIDRAVAVSQRLSDQFMFDFWFNCLATRPMPVYSVPGLDRL